MAHDDGASSKPAGFTPTQRVVVTAVITSFITSLITAGGLILVLSGGHLSLVGTSPASTATGVAGAIGVPSGPPTRVTLSVSAPGTAPTSQSQITFHSGTVVTLTVTPDQPLKAYQTYTMGIYAHDPYGFSSLQQCTYPHTDTCTYVLAYSSAEQTDYTIGTHTFTAYLGNVGGAILQHSNDITITWTP